MNKNTKIKDNNNIKEKAFDNAAKPNLVLGVNEKLYLAVASKSQNSLIFVYLMFLPRVAKTNHQYSMLPETQVATFNNAERANIYIQTVNEVLNYQHQDPVMNKFLSGYKEEIAKFLQKVK